MIHTEDIIPKGGRTGATGTTKIMKNDTIIHAGDRFTKNAATKMEGKKATADNLLSLITKPGTHLNSSRLLSLERAMDTLAYQEFSAVLRNRIAQQIFTTAETTSKAMHMDLSNWKLTEDSLDDFLNDDAWESFDADDERVHLWDGPYLQFIKKAKSATYALTVCVTSIQLDSDKWTPEQIMFYVPEDGEMDPLSEMITLTKECIKIDKDNNRWFYDLDTNVWAPCPEVKLDEEIEDSPCMRLEDRELPEDLKNIILGEPVNGEYDQESLQMYASLYDMTAPYMQCDEIELKEKSIPILVPADWKNCGYAVSMEHGDAVLCQYLDSATAIPVDQSEFSKDELKTVMDHERPEQTDDLYLREIARTKDAGQMAAWLKCLADRFLPFAIYLVPLSDRTYVIAESVADLLKDPKIMYFDDAAQQDPLTKEEEQALKDAYCGFMRALACSRIDTLHLINK